MEQRPLYIASCSFGKDSIATILLALEHNEPLDRAVFVEVMFDNERNISGEIPEHIEWVYSTAIPRLEAMGVKVDVVRSKQDYVTLCRKILKKGKKAGNYYGVQSSRFCYANSECKIAPIKRYYKSFGKATKIVQYVGIAIDEPVRLARLEGTNKVSLLAKYGYTEKMAMTKCEEYDLVSPNYRGGEKRGGCWFCYNAHISRYVKIRQKHPDYWQALRELYFSTNSQKFKYDKSLEEIEVKMNEYEDNKRQLKLF